MNLRKLGPFQVPALGLGCMSLSHAYGTPPGPDQAAKLLLAALDLGYTLFDTAALYGFGANENLVGRVLKERRRDIVLASKCGIWKNAEGLREIDGRPEILRKTCEESLTRLQTEVIDLYYLHRWDKRIPIEESIGGLADLVKEGKIRTIGLSEVSADTIRRAHRVHPIAAVQTEYSLWTRNAEIKVLEACRDLDITFVAFSPLARAFLTGTLRDPSLFEPKDLRRNMPRFQGENFARNLKLLDGLQAIAAQQGCSMGQLALAWLLAKSERLIAIPGTTKQSHLAENWGALEVGLDAPTMARLEALINPSTVHGPRYGAATQAEIDTEVE